jgi:hypothetical protein
MAPDNVFFIADSPFPENIVRKYHLVVLFDLKGQFDTLQRLADFSTAYYTACHNNVSKNELRQKGL